MNPAEFQFLAAAEQDFWWFRGMRQILFRILEPLVAQRPIRRVLEAGCGTGHFACQLEARYGWQVFPVDLAWEGLQHGRRLGVQRMAQCDIRRLPFPEGSFDAVFSLDVLVHFPSGEEIRALQELARVLAPKGLLVLRAAALKVLRSRHSQFTGECQRFTRARLKAAVERVGLRPLRISYANSLLLPVALAKFRLWEPLLRKPPSSGLQPLPAWLDTALGAALGLEARILATGVNLPLGQSLLLLAEKAH